MSACTAQLVGPHNPPRRRDECSDWLSGQRHPRQWPGHRCGCAADLQLQSRARLVACVQCCESLGLNVDLSWTLIFDQKARLFRLEAPIRLSICSLIRRFIHSFSFIHSSFIHSAVNLLVASSAHAPASFPCQVDARDSRPCAYPGKVLLRPQYSADFKSADRSVWSSSGLIRLGRTECWPARTHAVCGRCGWHCASHVHR